MRLLILMLCSFLFLQADSQNSFPNSYLFDNPPTAIFAQKIYNDTIVCIGVVIRDGDTINYQQGAFIAFIDSCGQLIRINKYFDPQGRDIFLNQSNKIIKTNDKGYCFVGQVGFNQLLIKTNNIGDVSWTKELSLIEGFESNTFLSIHEISNSLYVIGFGDNNNPYQDDLFLVKFDSQGELVSSKRFYTPENCAYFQDAITKANNLVISLAQTNACVSGGLLKSRTRIFEIDTSGNVIWDWVDEGSDLKRGGGKGLTPTSDGGWVYAGAYSDTFYFGNQYNRLFITKIDANHNHEWTRIIGYPDNRYNYFADISVDPEGNYLVAGQYTIGYEDFPNSQPEVCAIVAKITPLGDVVWTNVVKNVDGNISDDLLMFTYNINLLSSRNIIIGGYLYRFIGSESQNEGWLAKISPNGEVLEDILCDVSSRTEVLDIQKGVFCYPNPTCDFIVFKFDKSLSNFKNSSVNIYSQNGQSILKMNLDDSEKEIQIDTQNYAQGMYFYQILFSNNQIFSGKFTIIR